MKKIFIILTILSSFVFYADDNLNLKYGYINKNGDILIKPTFIIASDFSEGLSFVEKDNRKIIIDKNGNEISELPDITIKNKPFTEGLAVIVTFENNVQKSFFIDKKGKPVLDNEFISATSFTDNVAIISSMRGIEIIDKLGKVIYKFDKNELEEICINVLGECKMKEGLLPAMKKRDWKTKENGDLYAVEHWGYIDRNGNWAIMANYNKAASFSEGLGLINIGMISLRGLEEWAYGKYGFIDKKGNLVIKTIYIEAFSFNEGLAAVCEKDTWGFIDKKGEYVIKPKYDKVFSFSEGLAAVKIGNKWGFIDSKGVLQIQPIFESDNLEIYGYKYSEGLAPVKSQGKWGYIDKTGQLIIKPIFIEAHPFKEGLARVLVEINE